MGDQYPTVRLAAAQAASVFLDRDATVEKAARMIEEAGDNGAALIGFPESFVPAHPLWFHFHPATSATSMAFSRRLFKNAVTVPGPATDALCRAARRARVGVVIGICEKEPKSMGSMFNSLLVIDRDGQITGRRRKIVPTVGERIVHSAGSGDSVTVFPAEFGAISGLMCGENSNPLLTFSMQALGARVHIAAWPNFFNAAADMWGIADVACRSIAYQNSSFVISPVGAISDEMREILPATEQDRAYLDEARTRGGSAIYAPGGQQVLAGPMPGGEGIIYADADMESIVPRKIVHDYAGDYNRFDIFQLQVAASPAGPSIRLQGDGAAGPPRVWVTAGEGSGPHGLQEGYAALLGQPVDTASEEAPDGPTE